MPPREAFRIIDIPVYWYGIMIMLGVVAASFIAYREARRRGEDPEHVWQMFPWVLISGIVGARLAFVLVNLSDPRYSQNLVNVFAVWTGGLSIQGAIIGGALAVIIYCLRQRLSVFKWGDIIAPGLALAQGIGRWGNYFNQEAFGQPTTLPWGIAISVDRQREVAGAEAAAGWGPDTRFHPTFAYEMLWDLANFALLMWLGRQKRLRLVEGDLFWIYLVIYSVGRFAIEAIRVDSAKVSGIAVPQIVAILSILLAWGMFLYRHRPGSKAPLSEANLQKATGTSIAHSRRPAGNPPAPRKGSRVRKVSATSSDEIGDVTPGTAAHPTASEPSTESL